MTSAPTTIPSENDFLAAFGVEPVEAEPADGYWCYEFTAEDGEGLRFSFNVHERSVQTVWTSRGRPVCTVVHENASAVRVEEGAIRVEFIHEPNECRTTLHVQVFPEVVVRWSSILV